MTPACHVYTPWSPGALLEPLFIHLLDKPNFGVFVTETGSAEGDPLTQDLTALSYGPQALVGTCPHPESSRGAGIQVNVCFPTGAAGPCLRHSPDLTDEPLNTGTKADLGRPPGWCVCSVVKRTDCSQPCYRQAAERGTREGRSRAPSQMRAQAS